MPHSKTPKGYEKKMEEAQDWLRQVVKKRGNQSVSMNSHILPERGRAFHRSGNAWDSGVHLSPKDQVKVFIHEITHRLEDDLPKARRLTNAFRRMRIRRAKTKDVNLRDMFGSSYDDWETGNKDEFGKALSNIDAYYAGKSYRRGSTEILTMGIEQMFLNPVRFAKKDPEYFKFMVGVLRDLI